MRGRSRRHNNAMHTDRRKLIGRMQRVSAAGDWDRYVAEADIGVGLTVGTSVSADV